MKITSIQIHNFRGIVDMKIDIGSISLLVGPNNSGKSSVIDAIRAMYEKDGFKFSHDRDFPKISTSDDLSWIDVTYLLSQTENEKLPKEFQRKDRKLKVRRWFHVSDELSTEWKTGRFYIYLSDGKTVSKKTVSKSSAIDIPLGNLVYIPALSRVDEHLKLNGPSAMRDLMRIAFDGNDSTESKNKQRAKAIENLFDSLLGGKRKRRLIFENIESELKESLSSWDVSFRFSTKNHETEALIKALFGWELVDESTRSEIGIAEFGSGFQRHFTASLIQVVAKLANERGRKANLKDFRPPSLFLFEEPEAFLHPSQQSLLAGALRNLAKNSGMQIICTTHSPRFVSPKGKELSSIVKLSKKNGASIGHQVSAKRWQEIVEAGMKVRALVNGQNRDKLEEKAATQLIALKNSSWLRNGRNEFLFADEVLLVEGETERAFISQLLDDGKLRLQGGKNLYILDCLGKFNIPSFISLLSAFGVKHYVLFDGDGNKQSQVAVNEELKKLVKTNPLTLRFSRFPTDLEKYLGINREKKDIFDKPLQLMFDYVQGNISKRKIAALCKKLEELLKIQDVKVS